MQSGIPDHRVREVANRLRRRSTLQELSQTLAKHEKEAIEDNHSDCRSYNSICGGVTPNKQVIQHTNGPIQLSCMPLESMPPHNLNVLQ